MTPPTALIAEDEVLLAEHLRQELAIAWPELALVAQAAHGEAAVELALHHRPDVCFLDIRMPGLSGLEAASALADEWPEDAGPFPLLVFVTAYDQYAVQAFERSAVDYLLKPLQSARLAQCCERLRRAWAGRRQQASGDSLALGVEQLRSLLGAALPAPVARLRILPINEGSSTLMLPVDEVDYFEAADKYVRVLRMGREHLLRISLRELLPQLDPERFWQVHRSLIVRADAIERALRDEAGHVSLTLRGRPERLTVSRMYAPRFRGL